MKAPAWDYLHVMVQEERVRPNTILEDLHAI